MRKLTLEIGTLQVESFAVLPHPPVEGGTVHGRQFDEGPLYPDDGGTGGGGGGGAYTVGTCIGPTFCCPPTWRPTCAATCYGTCPASCIDMYCSY